MIRSRPKLFRYDLINYIAALNNAQDYLEIGIHDGGCLQKIRIENIVGVDPGGAAGRVFCTRFHPLPSDIYFELHGNLKYDVIFIDGLHTGDQVAKDIDNALKCLKPGGAIVLHDINPATAERERPDTNGDCWRAMYRLRTSNPNVIAFTIDADQGLGVILPKPGNGVNFDTPTRETINYSVLAKDRANVIGLVDTETGLAKIDEYYTGLRQKVDYR